MIQLTENIGIDNWKKFSKLSLEQVQEWLMQQKPVPPIFETELDIPNWGVRTTEETQ